MTQISNLTNEKTIPVGDDLIAIDDSEDSNRTKKVKLSSIAGSGSGDMTKFIYDPTSVYSDAFSMDNMNEGTNKILTTAERALIASALQSGSNISLLTNDSGFITDYTVTNTDLVGLNNSNLINDSGFLTDYTVTNSDLVGLNISNLTNDSSYLTSFTETDPVFLASEAYNIDSNDITNLSNLSGENTGDETLTSIKTKLGISVLSGNNTGDQDISGISINASDINNIEAKTDFITVSQSVNLDSMESDINTNNSKVSFPEAPIDGEQYARKDASWEIVTASGDMNKSVYDTDNDGVVDNSEALNSQSGSYYLNRVNHTGVQAISTITDLQDSLDNKADTSYIDNVRKNLSAGAVNSPSYVDNGDGSVTIGSGDYNLYSGSDFEGNINKYTVSGGTFVLTDEITNYIVVDYNSGSPIVKKITDSSLVNESDVIPLLSLVRQGTDICKVSWNEMGKGLANKLHGKDVKLNRFGIESGLSISETGTRNVIAQAGIVWNGTKRNSLGIVNTSGSNDICLFYHSSGSWTHTNVSQYNNTQYDDGTDLQSLTANKYAVNWIFRNVDESKESLCVVLGSANYSISGAESSPMPVLPNAIIDGCVFIGRIIVKVNDSTAYSVEQVQNVSLAYSQVSDHNELTGLQGGQADEYYHLDATDYAIASASTASFTTTLASNISTNNAKVSFDWDYDYVDLINKPTTITAGQASAIVDNTAKVSYTDATIVGLNSAFRITPSSVITAGTDLTWSGNTLNYTGTGGSGTVTSVAISGSDGIEVDSGSPITTSGTIALGVNKNTMLSTLNVEDGADVTDSANVLSSLDSATIPNAIITTTDNILFRDVLSSNVLRQTSVSNLLDLTSSTDSNAIHDNTANEISALTEKTTPVDDDIIIIEDSAASYVKKKVKISNLPSGSSGSSTVVITRTFSANVSTGDLIPIIITDDLNGLSLKEVRLASGSLPVGQALKHDLRKNGSATTDSVYTSDVPQEISTSETATNGLYQSGCNTSGSTVGTSGTSLDSARVGVVSDDVLYPYITQVGATITGCNLVIEYIFG